MTLKAQGTHAGLRIRSSFNSPEIENITSKIPDFAFDVVNSAFGVAAYVVDYVLSPIDAFGHRTRNLFEEPMETAFLDLRRGEWVNIFQAGSRNFRAGEGKVDRTSSRRPDQRKALCKTRMEAYFLASIAPKLLSMRRA
jgi:hypothetical protein